MEKIENNSGNDEKEHKSKSISFEEDKEICEQESTDEIEKETIGIYWMMLENTMFKTKQFDYIFPILMKKK